MSTGQTALLVVLALLVLFALVVIARTIRIVPQATAIIIERLGRFSRTLDAGLHLLIPFVDKPRAVVDLREQVVSFPPQPVITSDNLVVSIDTVIFFQVNEPRSAVYEIANYIQGIEQLTVTTLRNVVGSMDLEQTLTSRDQINGLLRGVLDEATGKWGVRVNRVELKSIDPPQSIQGSMEQQMRAERDRRAAVLTAEGVKQSQILTAEGEKQSAILRAEGSAQAAILNAQGEARAILQVFEAIHRGDPDQKLLAYQYLQMLPQIARGDANKVWIIPSEIGDALKGLGGVLGKAVPDFERASSTWSSVEEPYDAEFEAATLQDPGEALAEARRNVAGATAEAEGAATQGLNPAAARTRPGARTGALDEVVAEPGPNLGKPAPTTASSEQPADPPTPPPPPVPPQS